VTTTDQLFQEISDSFGAGNAEDIYPLFAERRRATPVMDHDILAEFGVPSMASGFDGSRPTFSLLRYDDITDCYRDPKTYSSSLMFDALGPFLGRIITSMDGDEHRRARNLLSVAFSRSMMDRWREEVTAPAAVEQVAELAPSGRCDFYRFAVHYPIRVIYEIIGLPPGDIDAYEQFACWGMMILLGFGSTDPTKIEQAKANMARALDASQALYDQLLGRVHEVRAAGAAGTDFISHLVQAEFEGQSLTDEEIAVMVRSLVPAAAETTTRSFANVLYCLLQRPEVLAEVAADRSLVPGAVSEALRYEAATVVNARITTRDVELRGVRIPAGSGVTLVNGAGHRDPDSFDDPETFDVRRKGKSGLAFGFGPHMCIGMAIARAEMEEALNAIFDHMPGLRWDPDQPVPHMRGVQFRSPDALPVVWD